MEAGKKLDDIFITSKIGPRFHGEDAAYDGCERALRALQTDTIVASDALSHHSQSLDLGFDADTLARHLWNTQAQFQSPAAQIADLEGSGNILQGRKVGGCEKA